VLADPAALARRAERIGLDVPVRVVEPDGAFAAFATALPVVALSEQVTAEPGHPDQSSAPAAIASIRRAVADVFAGRAHAMVTNPVAKAVLYRTGFAEPGHTEFLAKLAQEHTGRAAQPVMMRSPNWRSFRSRSICRCVRCRTGSPPIDRGDRADCGA
jgi:4-hydroxythreonine-4-phosphate dehydrogenase